MANEIKEKYYTSASMLITLGGLTNTSKRQSTQVTNASPGKKYVRVWYKITTGAAPTANERILFYMSRADDGSPELSDGTTGTSDAAYTGDVNQLDLVGAQVVSSASGTAYVSHFDVLSPGTDWRIVVDNESGGTLHADESTHLMRYQEYDDEIQ